MIRTQWLLLIYTAISLNSTFAEEHAKNTPSSLTSQLAIPDTTQIQVLETTDGSTNIGRIVEIGTEEIAFKTDLGLINTIGDEAIFPGVPYIDFVVQF